MQTAARQQSYSIVIIAIIIALLSFAFASVLLFGFVGFAITENDLGGNPQSTVPDFHRLHRAANIAFATFVFFEAIATWQLNMLRRIGIYNRIPLILQVTITFLVLCIASYGLVFLSLMGFVPDPVITANAAISEWILKLLSN